MTPEELLKPRYKVIADYPNSKFSIGTVIIPNRLDGVIDDSWVVPDKNDRSFAHVKVQDYPHLFRRLSWWEEREEKDMPEYVEDTDGNVSMATWRNGVETENGMQPMRMILHEVGAWAVVPNVMCFFKPA